MKMNLGKIGQRSLVYDGVALSDYFVVRYVRFPIMPPIDVNTIEIDGMPGAFFSSRKISTRSISIGLGFLGESEFHTDIFDEWLKVSGLIAKDKVARLDIGNNLYVYAMFTGESNISTNHNWSTVELNFECFDPFVYGEEHTVTLKSGNNVIDIKGSKPAMPVLELTASSTTVTIRNTTTGEQVRMTGVSSGSKIVVDMENYKATMNGNFKAVDPTVSDFWPVGPGEVTINLSGATGTMTYKERYL